MNEKKNTSKKALIILLAVLAALLLVFGGYMLARHQANAGPVTVNSASYAFEEGQSQAPVQEAGTAPGIEIPGYSIIPVKANTTNVKVELYNPDENNVYFQISLILTDTEEVLYQSDMIRPGDHLYEIELTRGLEPGEYPLTVQYDTFSTDGQFSPRNGATVNCFIKAE